MRITRVLLSAALGAGLAAGCVKTTTNPVTGKVDVDVESPTKHGEDWNAQIHGTGSNVGLNGTAKVLVMQGQSEVTINIQGAPAGATLPWHVHDGTCATGGPVVGDAAAYPPLKIGDDGKAQGSAKLSVGLSEANKYHVNVHASPSDLGTIIACGDLAD